MIKVINQSYNINIIYLYIYEFVIVKYLKCDKKVTLYIKLINN